LRDAPGIEEPSQLDQRNTNTNTNDADATNMVWGI
jgi:hypothetical protein